MRRGVQVGARRAALGGHALPEQQAPAPTSTHTHPPTHTPTPPHLHVHDGAQALHAVHGLQVCEGAGVKVHRLKPLLSLGERGGGGLDRVVVAQGLCVGCVCVCACGWVREGGREGGGGGLCSVVVAQGL